MKLGLFGSRPDHDAAVIQQIKRWAAQALGLPEGTSMTVAELRCGEEGCPDVETVIGVLDVPGKPRLYKVLKPLADVTAEDVGALCPVRGPAREQR